VLRVKSSPRRQIPAFGQRVEDDPEVCAFRASRAVEPFDVFNEDGSGAKSVNDSHELEEESAALPCEPGSLAGDGEVLAGEASAEEINSAGSFPITSPVRELLPGRMWVRNVPNVFVDGDAGESGCEDCSAVGVDLSEELVLEPGPLEPDVHATDA
jgi:hypothetical protein